MDGRDASRQAGSEIRGGEQIEKDRGGVEGGEHRPGEELQMRCLGARWA